MSSELARLSITDASALIRERKVSPRELVEAVFVQVAKHEPRVNAFISLLEERCVADARKAEQQIMRDGASSKLHGIPVALKDLYHTRGIRTTAGSKILENFVPEHNGTVSQKLEDAGSILIGKTNTHEFAYGPTSEDSHFGPTRNPWDASRIAGGSSGGSGASVASHMAYMAMGSDTGGSVRIPACLCGVVGFKPTYGLVSLYGVVPLSHSYDHAGPLTKSVRDAAIVMDVIAGHDRNDPHSSEVQVTHFEKALETAALSGVRVGVPINFFFDKTEPEIESHVRRAVRLIEDAGACVSEVTLPQIDDVFEVTTVIMGFEAARLHETNLRERAHEFQPAVRQRLEDSLRITEEQYQNALRMQQHIRHMMDELFCCVDILLTPCMPVEAYPIGTTTLQIKGKSEPARQMLLRHTRLANLTGGPAISLPCALTKQNLPCGVQLLGKPFDDISVLRAAHTMEKLLGFKLEVPEE